MSTKPLLCEIGVEELPSSFVDAALAALPDLVTKKLAATRIPHGDVQVYGTPRRLAFLVERLAERQADLDEEVTGPPEGAAYKDGAPTRAAVAFAEKLGVPVSELVIVERVAGPKNKPGRYVVGRRKERGREAVELLGTMVSEIAGAIPFRKSMRWGSADATFGRPVQWLVVLFGADVVNAEFAGVRSGRKTRGHRFLAPLAFPIEHPDFYLQKLREAHVFADRDERARLMMERVAVAAAAAGGQFDPDPMLVSENGSLVEEPHVVTGGFEKEFLALPASVIRAVARGHQRYFCIHKGEDELLPAYLAIANTANHPDKVAKGNDRVMRARLADARFFFEEDRKQPLDAKGPKLGGIVFHARLGTVKEKVERIAKVAAVLAGEVGADAAATDRAARLAKCDLVSLMVGEFPELQGEMGRAYALHGGESPAVADAIRDHYKPAFATDAIPASDVARVIALADRLDTLVGCFAVGLSPTGAADPFALRRACIAILRTLIESAESGGARYGSLAFSSLLDAAYGAYAGTKLDLSLEETRAKLLEFASERLRGLLATRVTSQVSDAILAGHTHLNGVDVAVVEYPALAMAKALALGAAWSEDATSLGVARAVGKRLSGISKAAKPVLDPIEAFDASPADRAKNEEIVLLVSSIEAATKELSDVAKVRGAIADAARVAARLETLFETLLVNDPDDPLTPKRLELLSFGADCMLRIADFSRLA